MENASDKLKRCFEYIKSRTDFEPQAGLVLGSGLGGFADHIEICDEIAYGDIDGFPVSTVSGHDGRFIFGRLCGINIVAMRGRVHCYEGYDMADVVLPIRLMRMLGAGILVITNAAGGINRNFSAGDFMLINGHISSLVSSPLIGKNLDELGTRFPDMSEVYDAELRRIAKNVAARENIALREGIYIQVTGPNYETPEEIRMFRLWGADAVGMSTACEAIAARHASMRVCAVSCISNMAAGISGTELSHLDVKNMANMVAERFRRLLMGIFEEIGNTL